MPAARWVDGCCIGDTDRIGRFGVMFVRLLAAQAGWLSTETSPGEDHKAIDLSLDHEAGSVSVQVKTGSARGTKDHEISLTLTQKQVDKLKKQQREPVYIVYVRVPRGPQDWVRQMSEASGHHAVAEAYWLRFDTQMSGRTVRVPMQNRLTADTLAEWLAHWGPLYDAEVTP